MITPKDKALTPVEQAIEALADVRKLMNQARGVSRNGATLSAAEHCLDTALASLKSADTRLTVDEAMDAIEGAMVKRCHDHTPYRGACVTCGGVDNPLVLPSVASIRTALTKKAKP